MGLFTSLNAIGRNLSPLAAAPITDRFRFKRNATLMFWILCAGCWAVLTMYLWTPAAANRSQSIWIFGACYTLFFVFLGAASVGQGALLGKIIPAGVRGRAMAMGMTLSGVINVGAILFIYQIIRGGRFPEPRNYALAFTFTTVFFLMGAVAILFVQEPPSEPIHRRLRISENLGHFARLSREYPNLRRLMVVNLSIAVGGSMLQFYTGFWRKAGTMTPDALVMATVFQVFWQSLASSVFGRVADRVGNRHVICGLIWIEALVPLAALALGGWEPFREDWRWYLGVYTLVGIRFPMYQLLINYLLEIVPQREHAMAIGAVTTAQLVTAPAPILLGIIAGIWGYAAAFILASAFGIYGAITALTMEEVRVRT